VCGESFKTAQGRAGHLRLATDARHVEALRAERERKAQRAPRRGRVEVFASPPAREPEAKPVPLRAAPALPGLPQGEAVRPAVAPAPVGRAPEPAPKTAPAPMQAKASAAEPPQGKATAPADASQAPLPAPPQGAQAPPPPERAPQAPTSAASTVDAPPAKPSAQAPLAAFDRPGPAPAPGRYPGTTLPTTQFPGTHLPAEPEAPKDAGQGWAWAAALVAGALSLGTLVASLKGAKDRQAQEPAPAPRPAAPPGPTGQDTRDMMAMGWPAEVLSGGVRPRHPGGFGRPSGWRL
jgi:hypothetical protein